MLEVLPSNKQLFEYLIGVVQGDGCITFNKHKGKRYPSGITIAVGLQDENYTLSLMKIIHEVYPNQKIIIRKDANVIFNVCFYNSAIARDFYKFKKKGKWTIPPLQYPEYYVAGLWDTDGNVGTDNTQYLSLYVKKSDNLLLVKPLMETLGFNRTKIMYSICRKEERIFHFEGIHYISKKNVLHFAKTIPLQHPRKIKEMKMKAAYYDKIKGRRGHNEMLEIVIDFLKLHPGSSSLQIALHLKKCDGSHITKELLRYTKKGKITRKKEGNRFMYFVV